MAQKLRLKSQTYSSAPDFGCTVEVFVDTGIAHLDESFSYLASSKDMNVEVGSLVNVPFGSKTLPGIVISKSNEFHG